MAPAARNGPNGTRLALAADPGGDEDEPDHRAVEEPEEQAEHHLAPAEHAEREARG